MDELHLLMGLDLQNLPTTEPAFRLSSLLNPPMVNTLESRGVNLKRLLSQAGDLDLMALLPEPEFWHSTSGRRILDLLSACSRPGPGGFSILLTILLRPGPVSETLKGCGLNEPMLIEILTDLSASCVDDLLASCDLSEPDWEHLRRLARLALVVGWNCSERKCLQAQNLLDGLLCADMLCQPGQGATKVLHRLNILGFAHAATRKMVTTFDRDRRELQLSPEVRQALQLALEVAGEKPVGTQHLLYGLARIGLPELTQHGLTGIEIHELL